MMGAWTNTVRLVCLGGLVCALALAACAPQPTGALDVRDGYPITPVPTRYVLGLRLVPGSGEIGALDAGRFERFIRQYHRRGRTTLVVATTADEAGRDADRHMAKIRRHLIDAGVDERVIEVRSAAAPLGSGNGVIMSFEGYSAKVADCGDWTGGAGNNPTNLPHTNYGCSYQRNIGMMLADPGDLLRSQNDSYIEAYRVVNVGYSGVVPNYRAGAPTPATGPGSEAPGLSDIQ